MTHRQRALRGAGLKVPPPAVSMQRTPGEMACLLCLAAALLGSVGCHQDMYDQPRYEPLESSEFYPDGKASRDLPAGTIPRGYLQQRALREARRNGKLVEEIPLTVDRELLERGQQRYNIYCSICHGLAGNGDGMIVQRGFRRPPSYHTGRLRSVPVGHFFDVISNGWGVMPSLAPQVEVRDRWAIAAYLRALQLSQGAPLKLLSPDERERLTSGGEQQPSSDAAAAAENGEE